MPPQDHVAPPAIGWGFLGASGISRTVAADLAITPGARLVAVGSRDAARAAAFAAEVAADRAHASYDDLVLDPDVDVVYVGTTHESHAELAGLAIAASKAVLCEKPFAVSVAQAAPVLALAAERGVFCMEALWTRFVPAIRAVLDLVADGAIGAVVHVSATFALARPYDGAHRLFNPATAGGALLDLGIYPLTFARLVLGAPTTVAASSRVSHGVDLSTQMLLGHASGATAGLGCSFEAALPTVGEIHGTRGRIVVPDFLGATSFAVLRQGRAGGLEEPEEVVVPRLGRGYVHELTEVVRCVREGLLESPLMPHAETLGVLATMDEVRRQVGVRYPFE